MKGHLAMRDIRVYLVGQVPSEVDRVLLIDQLEALGLELEAGPEGGPSAGLAWADDVVEAACTSQWYLFFNDQRWPSPAAEVVLGVALAKAWMGTGCRILVIGPCTSPLHELPFVEAHATWEDALGVLRCERPCVDCGERMAPGAMERVDGPDGPCWVCPRCCHDWEPQAAWSERV
jgi:hypothetical protein